MKGGLLEEGPFYTEKVHTVTCSPILTQRGLKPITRVMVHREGETGKFITDSSPELAVIS